MMRRNSDVAGATISDAERTETSKKAVIKYSLCLFVAVVFFTLLSYMIQERDNARADRLYSENATAIQHIETLREEYSTLQEKYDELLASYNNLMEEIETEVSEND